MGSTLVDACVKCQRCSISKEDGKTRHKKVTRTISIPKSKVIKKTVQQACKPAANDAARAAIKPTMAQKPLPNQQIS